MFLISALMISFFPEVFKQLMGIESLKSSVIMVFVHVLLKSDLIYCL